MTIGEGIVNSLIQMIKDTKVSSILTVSYESWKKITYDEKSIIHDIATKYSLLMNFDNKKEKVYLIYNK